MMFRTLSKLAAIACLLSVGAYAASLFPPLAELSARASDEGRPAQIRRGNALVFQAQVEPSSLNHLVKLSVGDDGIVLDSSALAGQDFRKVVTGWETLDQRQFDDDTYQIKLDVTGPEKGVITLYFEGRTDEGKHFYKPSAMRSNGQRSTLSAISTLPPSFQYFHLRFDFSTPGVYRIHDVSFAKIDSYSRDPEAPRRSPELIFHAPFDGNALPAVAKGNPQPLSAERLEFQPGVLGQALRVTKDNRADLRYATGDNIVPNCGTIALWVKPDWGDLAGVSYAKGDYHCFFCMDRPAPRNGSGAIWLWAWGAVPRADTSDISDSYKTATKSLASGQWAHIAMTWDENGSALFVNGRPAKTTSDGHSPLATDKNAHLILKNQNIPFFFVGSHRQEEFADALLDDLRIYSAPLSADEVYALASEQQYFTLDMQSKYVHRGADKSINATINITKDGPMAFTWKLLDEKQQLCRQSNATISAPPRQNGARSVTLNIAGKDLAPGKYQLIVSEVSGNHQGLRERQADILIFRDKNPWLSEDSELALSHVATIVPHPDMNEQQLLHVGPLHIRSLNGRNYLEADSVRGSRFVVRAALPDKDAIYLLEWDYPDDKRRSADIVAQSALCQASEYELQTGYAAGDEYANSNDFITQKCLYFPRSEDIAIIFMTARKNAPAAVAEIRIHKVLAGLPPLAITAPPPVNDWQRSLGLYFEDPAILYDFGVLASSMATLETTIDRCAAYMKYSGQDILTYPVVWYHGRIGDGYNPRNHPEGFMGAFLSKFDQEGLGFMASLNQHNMPIGRLKITGQTIKDGSLHASPISIWNTGRPNPGGWHGTSPNFNILHPDVQAHVLQNVDEIIAEGTQHPSFKGITFHLTKHAFLWFGDIEAGYNDYAIDAFTKDTGIAVPVNRQDPLRGKAYAEWLQANAFSEWVDWRCRVLAVFYKNVARRLRDARPDLRLNLCSFHAMPRIAHPDYTRPDFNAVMARQAGLDPAHYDDCDNIVITQTIYPADYRWRDDGRNTPADAYEHLRVFDSLPGCYDLLKGVKRPWLHQHDRYWESAIGSQRADHWSDKPSFIASPWFRETPWRVSTINPAGRHAMRHFVLPLRYHDLLAISKGGFLVGTHGMEEYLRHFAKAFRALPAQTFADLDTHSEIVVARILQFAGDTWFYIANTGDTPAVVTLAIAGDDVLDLVSGKPLDGFRDNHGAITLAPYELRSFKTSGNRSIGVRVPD
ncbi:MAG: LamG domain-containing protein [Lentisphaerae bacterium]|nr:LamG domain-containing protein [Lentisphaerota bacterium]